MDTASGDRYVPHVIEPAAGLGRTVLTLLCDAYDEDEIGGEQRTVLRLMPKMAPIKVAVLPLVNKEGQPERAREIYEELRELMPAEFDTGGSIGKRYRRQDEIGTPWGVTVDHQTMDDGTVTVRDRDTLEQVRIPAARSGLRASGPPRRALDLAQAPGLSERCSPWWSTGCGWPDTRRVPSSSRARAAAPCCSTVGPTARTPGAWFWMRSPAPSAAHSPWTFRGSVPRTRWPTAPCCLSWTTSWRPRWRRRRPTAARFWSAIRSAPAPRSGPPSAAGPRLGGVVAIAPAGLDMAGWFAIVERDAVVRSLLASPLPCRAR